MTGHYCDIGNADVILTCGSNNVENHPVSAKWCNRAVEKGGKWIVVDPRYTRTAALSDLYCPIRSGTDIAFYGGLINYIIENDLWQHEYVLNYTNATYLINPDYDFDPEDGLFSGWNEATGKYDTTSWGYQIESTSQWDTTSTYSWATAAGVPEFTPPTVKTPKKDATLTDENCVFNIMKNHYSRYDMDTVSSICGMDKDVLEEVYALYGSTGAPEKTGTILYALGQTQHHYGTQNTRIMCMVQLLLGNVGCAGGGVNALRGEPNVQGPPTWPCSCSTSPATSIGPPPPPRPHCATGASMRPTRPAITPTSQSSSYRASRNGLAIRPRLITTTVMTGCQRCLPTAAISPPSGRSNAWTRAP